ncbi:MAG: hypothetical protein ABEI07_02215 [Candidatus Nanohaloarchaea archaeon]
MDAPDLETRQLLVTALLSLVAVAPLFFFDPVNGLLKGQGILEVLYSAAALLFLLPLPAAYVASVSTERFRYEAVGGFASLPLAVFGTFHAAFAVSLGVGLLLVSYKTRSVYHGDNFGWSTFKSAGSLVFVLALVLGFTAAYTYQSSPGLRGELQDRITNRTVDIAVEYADISRQSIAPKDEIQELAGRLSENVSRTSIALTEKMVFEAVQRSGTFSPAQKTLLRNVFDRSKNRIPETMSRRIEATAFNTGNMSEAVPVEEIARQRIEPFVEKATAPAPHTLTLIFLTVASLVHLFKMPFRLLGGFYAYIFRSVENRAGELF